MISTRTYSRLLPSLRHYSTASSIPTAHSDLTYIPNYLTKLEQQILLHHSLKLLSSPTQTTSSARKKARDFKRLNPNYSASSNNKDGEMNYLSFMGDEGYEFSSRHSDGVIQGYREMLVRAGLWETSSSNKGEGLEELGNILRKLYKFIPRPQGEPEMVEGK